MDVRRQQIRLVQRADADELAAPVRRRRSGSTRRPCTAGSARSADRRRSRTACSRARAAAELRDAVGFDHRVQRERRAGLALAPATMAAVNEQRRAFHAIAHVRQSQPPSSGKEAIVTPVLALS